MRREIHLTVTYPHPIDRVWAAISDSTALSAWFMPNDFEPRLGHRFTFRAKPAPGFDGVVHAEVTELEPPRVLGMSWRGGPLATTHVWFRLTPVEDGTRLDLEHTGFAGPRGVLLSFLFSGGWPRLLRSKLAGHLDGVTDPEHKGEMSSRRQRMIARLAALPLSRRRP